MNIINKILLNFNLQISKIQNGELSNDLFLRSINPDGSNSFFLRGGSNLYKNLISIGFSFRLDEYGNAIGEFNNIKMFVQSIEDLFILNEIYSEGTYNFSLPVKCVIIDIGMNVGFSSLFFSSSELVHKIISFEPVTTTFQQGLKNFELNPELKSKIEPYNYGIGGNTRQEEFIFSQEWKGSVGLRGLEESKAISSKKLESVKVQIQDIADAILIAKSFKLPVVAKIDSEGAEYEIIERLDNLHIIELIDLYMIEWHDKGSQRLAETLQKAEFSTITFNPFIFKNVGMLYAYKYNLNN